MTRYEISTDPSFYGSDVTEDEAREGAVNVVSKLSDLYPDALFEIVTGAPREECIPGEEDQLDEIRQLVNDNWADWI